MKQRTREHFPIASSCDIAGLLACTCLYLFTRHCSPNDQYIFKFEYENSQHCLNFWIPTLQLEHVGTNQIFLFHNIIVTYLLWQSIFFYNRNIMILRNSKKVLWFLICHITSRLQNVKKWNNGADNRNVTVKLSWTKINGQRHRSSSSARAVARSHANPIPALSAFTALRHATTALLAGDANCCL